MSEFLTTREVADLLRIKERKVYDLASSGVLPCNKAIGKLLFPRDQIMAWLANHAEHSIEPLQTRPSVIHGSHDPLLEWALRESRCGLATLFDGSTDGLKRFIDREGVACGLHIHDAGDSSWNVNAVKSACGNAPVVLLEWAKRQRGLLVSGQLRDKLTGIKDIAGYRVVPRQAEAGAQVLFEQLLALENIALDNVQFTSVARTENDVATAIASGEADAGFGLESLAKENDLHFIPLLEERFDLLMERQSYFEPAMQNLFKFCSAERFQDRVQGLQGYDVSKLGEVHFNGSM